MINQVYVKLNTYEFNRYFKWVSDGFMKSIRPFIFRDENGDIYCLHHGDENGLMGGYTVKSIREYAENHSNIREDENLNLICCFGSSVEDGYGVKVSINKTPYPVIIGADPEESAAVFGVLESDDDIPELVKICNKIL